MSDPVSSHNRDTANEGIACNVGNCIHNDHHRGCTACRIEIGPSFAATSGDTVCRSFEQQHAAK